MITDGYFRVSQRKNAGTPMLNISDLNNSNNSIINYRFYFLSNFFLDSIEIKTNKQTLNNAEIMTDRIKFGTARKNCPIMYGPGRTLRGTYFANF